MTPVVLVTGRYHLGDSPGLFQDALYVGHRLELPFHGPWFSGSDTVTFRFYCTDVETWAEWQGHAVAVNDTEIGFLRDRVNGTWPADYVEVSVLREVLERAIGGSYNFSLSVSLGRQPTQPGMADDFALLRIETDETFGATLGSRTESSPS